MSETIRKGIHVGLVVGGAIGFVIGLVLAIDEFSTQEHLEFMGWVVGLIVGLMVTGPIGLVIGALIGAFVGWVQGRNSSSKVGREVAIMGGGTAKVIVGAVLIPGGILVISLGFISVGLGVEEWPYVVLAGLAMAGLGLFVLLDGTKESLKQEKQEKKGGVPEVRSSNELVCRNCGSLNKQGLDKCIWCGADLK